ncbi:MAG: LysE family translocator [Thermoprotei archaeon]|nr:LysE family translocator [TACK group archaeon]
METRQDKMTKNSKSACDKGLMLTWAAGILLGFSLAAPPGPMNGLIAFQSLSSPKKGTLTGAGAMTADLMFMLLSLEVSRLLISYRKFFYVAGAGAMIYLALLTSKRRAGTSRASAGMPYVEGLLAGITNPFQVGWWLTVGTGFISAFGTQGVLGLFSAILVWILAFPMVVSSAGRFWGSKAWSAVKWASVLVMSTFAIYFLLQAISAAWVRRPADAEHQVTCEGSFTKGFLAAPNIFSCKKCI